jgi:hypothetical protein
MKFWHAELDTRNFHFEGFGPTEYAARRALHTALTEHAGQYELEGTGWYFPDDCRVREIVLGQGYRDREPCGEIHMHAAPLGGLHLSDPSSFKGPKG